MRWPWQKRARRRRAVPAAGPAPRVLAVQADMQALRMEFTDQKKQLKDLRRKVSAFCSETSQRANCPELFESDRSGEKIDEPAADETPRGTNVQPFNKHQRRMLGLQAANAGCPLPLGAWATPIDDDDDDGDLQ